MEREHTVSMSVTNGAECICNPEILLGTVFGLWNMEQQRAPRGTLLDLNAAWELFLSKKELVNDLRFDEEYHHQHEVIDGVVYEDGDTTYTLMDADGNKTNATFTIKANKGPVEHIEWEQGNLILYYTKTRPLTTEDTNSGVPIHYVYDNNEQPVIDSDTGQPLVYDYVKIPVIEIFDNHETHKLFPWFADDQHTIRLRQSLDGDVNQSHLGDFAVTSDSEVFIAKERHAENQNNVLVSLQSLYEQLKTDLGITPSYTTTNDYSDTEGNSTHQRATGSNIGTVLNTSDKTSIIAAINENKNRVDKTHKLINATDSSTQNELLEFCEYILEHKTNWTNNTRNLLEALNWIQDNEIGDFIDDINIQDADTITEALNIIFDEAEDNKERIGFANDQWIELNTDSNSNLTEAINEVDEHNNALADIIDVRERRDQVNRRTYYENSELNAITKGRLRPTQPNKNNTTIVEDINELQSQIGNLDQGRSGISAWPELTTTNKNTIVEAINEVDLHADNNDALIGAQYSKNSSGEKTGDITNLQTESKGTLVDAINELNSNIGELGNLDSEDQSSIVDSINEVIEKSPIVYEDPTDPDSGIKLKDQQNTAGQKSLVVGENNTAAKYSIVGGQNNNSIGNHSIVTGKNNVSRKQYSQVSGESNTNKGSYNNLFGRGNILDGDNNILNGVNNDAETNGSLIIGDGNTVDADNVAVLGDSNNVTGDDANALGSSNVINGRNSTTIGKQNVVNKDTTAIGINNESRGEQNFVAGKDNFTNGNSNVSLGNIINVEGNKNFIIGENQSIEGDENIIVGNSQKSYEVDNAIIIGEINTPHDDSTHIGRDIYIQTHDTESKLQSLIFVDLNDWCKSNNSSVLNGEKFLDSIHLVSALKTYLNRGYTDNAIIRFKMQDDNENGFIIVQGKSKRIYANGTWYFSDNVENGWSRHEGTYLKVIRKDTVDGLGRTVTKYYLAFKDQLSTEDIVDTTGAQRCNSEDYRDINLTHAYGAVDFDDFDVALGLSDKLRNKVDKSAKVITKYHNANGTIIQKEQNFIDPNNPNLSGNIILDLENDFGFNPDTYQLRIEKGEPNGYVPLNSGGLVDSQYLPSYIDNVIEVWAEYNIDNTTGAACDIHLYEIVAGDKGQEILQGNSATIYVEANPSSQRRFATQFRWTGTQFIAIGFSNLVIGEVTGSAYDGGKGKRLKDDFDDHIKSGTTTVSVEGPVGVYSQVTYNPNPHHVTPEQMSVSVNDPNDPTNYNLDSIFIRTYNVADAIQLLFNRMNSVEDSADALSAIVGTTSEINQLNNKTVTEVLLETKQDLETLNDTVGTAAEISQLGNDTVVGVLLDTKNTIDSLIPETSEDIQDIVNDNLLFYGEE